MSYTPPPAAATSTTLGMVKLAGDLDPTSTGAAPKILGGYARATGGGVENLSTNSAASGAVTLNLNNGNVFSLTLTGNVTSMTVSNATSGKACSFSLYLKQDGTGNRAVSGWPSGTKWSGGAPTLSTAANAMDIVVMESLDGGTTWYASLVGTSFA